MQTALRVKLSLFMLCCFAGYTTPAQFNVSKLELGADVNGFIYQGDLTPQRPGSLKTIKAGLGVYGYYKLSDIFSLKTNLVFGSLKGDESKYSKPVYRQQRNFKFTTPVTEISESIAWNIIPPRTKDGPRLTPYLSAGAGYAFLHIQRDYSQYNFAYFGQESVVTTGLGADTAHSLPKGTIVFPLSVGLRYSLNQKLSLDFVATYRLSSTDYLDGFSQSADPAKKDYFFTAGIGVIYSFGKKNMLTCPKMRY